jgi:glycolate oxidase
MDIISALKSIVGEHVLSSKEDLIPYQKDASFYEGVNPLAVVIPRTTEEVSKIMKFCYDNNIEVVTRGGGTSLTGSSILTSKGIMISMERFDKILEAKIEDRYVIVEPGVRIDNLNSYLALYSYFYPPDPASSIAATVGGSIATNAGGLRAAMYGATKEWVLGLEVVLPTGKIVQFGGKILKRTLGYDLTAIMIGSEGTLGIITKAILKIAPLPEQSGRILTYFSTIETAGEAVSELKKNGITPLIAEFMDRYSMDAITKIKKITFPKDAKYLLIIDIASTKESINNKLEESSKILKKFNPIDIQVTTDPVEMDRIYQARKGLYSSQLQERADVNEYVIIGDVVVPTSELPNTLKEASNKIGEYGFKVVLFGHIGDGNIHTNIFADVKDPEKMKKADSLMIEIGKIAIKHGGSVSSEHGIGLEKRVLLIEEFKQKGSLENLEIMKNIKKIFDPKNLLNRGKIFE